MFSICVGCCLFPSYRPWFSFEIHRCLPRSQYLKYCLLVRVMECQLVQVDSIELAFGNHWFRLSLKYVFYFNWVGVFIALGGFSSGLATVISRQFRFGGLYTFFWMVWRELVYFWGLCLSVWWARAALFRWHTKPAISYFTADDTSDAQQWGLSKLPASST